MAQNRLRRKLEEADQATLSKINENFCKIGTPLPPLDAWKRDPNEYKPIWQQEARDEQGRRRFHGAFTGGFSAGYFNTVGSKEGWTPSSFRSSRSDKAKGQSSTSVKNRPEDFMDDEDLADFQDASQLRTSAAYTESSGSGAGHDPLSGIFGDALTGRNSGELAAAALDDLVRPSNTSLGFQLLRKMGWKDGHGIGPRVTAKKRKRLIEMQERVKATEQSSLRGEEHDEEADKHLFPPPDTKLVKLDAKTDKAGLGWKRGSSLGELLSQARSGSRHQSQNDNRIMTTGADSGGDEDVFAADDDIRDSTLGRRRGLGSSDLSSTRKEPGLTAGSETSDRTNTWLDGRKVIDGFRRAAKAILPEAWFAPPAVPKGWQPNPQAVWDRYATKHPEASATSAGLTRPAMDATARGTLLGEVRMPGPPPALSDFLSAKARERLEAAAAGADLPQNPAAPREQAERVEIPPTDSRTAMAALQGFMPFGDNPAKQERYRKYLQSQADPTADVSIQRAPDQRHDHFTQELREFAKSAAIFRPMSTAMASRFTSASSGSAAQEIASPAPGLRQPKPQPQRQDAEQDGEARTQGSIEQLSPAQQAARAGMFGQLTRTVEPWYPVRLLCKRFNVPDPHPGRHGDSAADDEAGPARHRTGEPDPFYGPTSSKARVHGDVAANDLWEKSKRHIQDMAQSKAWESSAPKSAATRDASSSTRDAASTSFETLGLGDDERQGADTATYVKPPVDIFKAIFASDEEDGDSSDEDVGRGSKASGLGSRQGDDGGGGGGVSKSRHAANTALSDPTTSFRPAFIPRSKRKAAGDHEGGNDREDEEGTGGASLANSSTKKRGEKKHKKDRKTKRTGMLTFDLDGEDEEGGGPLELRRGMRPQSPSSRTRDPAAAGDSTDAQRAKDDQQAPSSKAPANGARASRLKASDLF